MSQQVWNIQPAEVLVVAGSIHTKPFCWLVSAPCLETPCGGCSSPSWGRAALLGLVGPFCSLRCGSGTDSSWCNRINTGFVSYSTVLSSDHTSQGHLRAPGPGQGWLKQQGKETSHGPALPFLACVVASHSWSFVIHAGIVVRVENVRLTFYLGLGAPTTGNILVMGCPL